MRSVSESLQKQGPTNSGDILSPSPAEETGVRAPRPWSARRVWLGTRKHGPSACLDMVAVALAFLGAVMLRFDGNVPAEFTQHLVLSVPLAVGVYLATYLFTGVYWRAWQYGGLTDCLHLAKSTAVGTGVVLAADLMFGLMFGQRFMPISVVLAGGAFSLLAVGPLKLLPRILRTLRIGIEPGHVERLLIVGAGEAGQWLVREIRFSARHPYVPVCFVDDDPYKMRMRVHGIAVLGTRADIPALVERERIDVVAVAIPSASGAIVREIVGICQRTNAKVRIVPGVSEILTGTGAPLREVTVEDLLGRDPVQIDLEQCRSYVDGQVVLVTGASGSIGSELARQLANLNPALLVVLDNNESGLYDLELQLKTLHVDLPMAVSVCNVERGEAVDRVFAENRPALVFHAAAYKHVPLMEQHVEQAVLVNVVGTSNIFASAQRHGADRIVLISTDKAVNPANVMGATKRMCEELVRSYASHSAEEQIRQMLEGATSLQPQRTLGPRCCAVRFGNVLESRGSVIPTFAWQIDHGGPVTVTHPEMKRYFMTIPEAASLVLQAAAFGVGNDIFLLDMGEEVSISELATKMILARGLRPGKDIEIVYTGLRPGEKLCEELVFDREQLVATPHPKIRRVAARPGVHLNLIHEHVDQLRRLALAGERSLLRDHLFSVVQSYDASPQQVKEPLLA